MSENSQNNRLRQISRISGVMPIIISVLRLVAHGKQTLVTFAFHHRLDYSLAGLLTSSQIQLVRTLSNPVMREFVPRYAQNYCYDACRFL